MNPMGDAAEQEKENFYELFTLKVDQIRQHDMILVQGKFNGKMGKEAAVRPVARKYSFYEELSNNSLLLAHL